MHETSRAADTGNVTGALGQHDPIHWRAQWTLEKFDAADIARAGLNPANAHRDDIVAAGVKPSSVMEREGNLLVYGGASALWHRLTGGTAVAAFSNTNAHIGVGDSSTAAAATQTDLQAATNKLRKVMDATYPVHTDGTGAGAETVQFKATFGTGDANYAWNEWGIFNAVTAGRMLNRKVESLGTKTSSATWAFTCSVSLA